MQHCARSVNGCYRILIILAFLCGRAKKIEIRFVWMRISDTCGQGLITYNLKNNEKIQRANATAYGLQMNPSKQK